MPNTLNVTALTTLNGKSIFQCWALSAGFQTSSQAGTTGAAILQLGSLANASYSLIPPHFNAGLHNAPNVQWVVFLSGLAHISLPDESLPINGRIRYATDAWVEGGEFGTILATDVVAASTLGHVTVYPSSQETRALQIPTEGGVVPEHTILDARNPCSWSELAGRKRASLEGLD